MRTVLHYRAQFEHITQLIVGILFDWGKWSAKTTSPSAIQILKYALKVYQRQYGRNHLPNNATTLVFRIMNVCRSLTRSINPSFE